VRHLQPATACSAAAADVVALRAARLQRGSLEHLCEPRHMRRADLVREVARRKHDVAASLCADRSAVIHAGVLSVRPLVAAATTIIWNSRTSSIVCLKCSFVHFSIAA